MISTTEYFAGYHLNWFSFYIYIHFLCSFLSHKEFRFLLPILPVSMHYCGIYFQSLCRKPRIKKKKLRKKSDSVHAKSCSSSESLVSSDSSITPITPQSTATMHVIDGTIDESKEVDEATCVPENQHSSETSKTINEDPFEKQQRKHKYNLKKAKYLVLILIVSNLLPAMYFGVMHQRGTTVVMKYVYDESLDKEIDVMFLMPCHSTPYYR